MHDRESRHQGKANQNRRTSAALGGRSNDRHHQHQAHFEKHRHADQDAQAEQRPRQAALPAVLHQRVAQGGCSAGARQQAAENRAQSQHDGDVSHQVADPERERKRNLLKGMPEAMPSAKRTPPAPAPDADGPLRSAPAATAQPRRAEQKKPIWRGSSGEGHAGIIPYLLYKGVPSVCSEHTFDCAPLLP